MEEIDVFRGTYIDSCSWRIQVELAAFDRLVAQAPSDDAFEAELEEFQAELLVALVGQMEGMFAYRRRALEAPGGPLQEVRAVAESIHGNGGRFEPPAGSALDPAATVLGLEAGDAIELDRDSFQDLADAFFNAIESTYRDRSRG
ncbi:hypothetical protein [Demequina subtropica]|uniref:hypothetical protein n=1 Tax=Demequina subtropica TaxID=1638989 RepID=UPI000785973A|nr:hypothetical protein [Demequina subtropica]